MPSPPPSSGGLTDPLSPLEPKRAFPTYSAPPMLSTSERTAVFKFARRRRNGQLHREQADRLRLGGRKKEKKEKKAGGGTNNSCSQRPLPVWLQVRFTGSYQLTRSTPSKLLAWLAILQSEPLRPESDHLEAILSHLSEIAELRRSHGIFTTVFGSVGGGRCCFLHDVCLLELCWASCPPTACLGNGMPPPLVPDSGSASISQEEDEAGVCNDLGSSGSKRKNEFSQLASMIEPARPSNSPRLEYQTPKGIQSKSRNLSVLDLHALSRACACRSA